ncbi:MAG: hypothetical protein EBR02_04920 [Alphaproteobacteria bacterium]|nr:hypothetical protein [Alphaproteobacteria bacterium]
MLKKILLPLVCLSVLAACEPNPAPAPADEKTQCNCECCKGKSGKKCPKCLKNKAKLVTPAKAAESAK